MGISSVGSFPVQSGGSLIFFQLFRCRNLALNRVFSYFLVAGMFFILGDVWMAPTFVQPHLFVCPIHLFTLRVVHLPYAPILLCGSVCFWRFCMLWGL